MPKKDKPKEPTEEELQKSIFHWVSVQRLEVPELNRCFAISNEAGYKRAHHWRAMGLKRGVSDILLDCESGCGTYRNLWIELKTSKGKLSEHQELFLLESAEAGSLAVVVRTLEGFQSIVYSYLTSEEDEEGDDLPPSVSLN